MGGESIQIDEGGFARVHNDILSTLAVARFTGSEFRCLLFLLRMTYGWQKKEDAISVSQWAEGVGVEFEKRHNVWRTLQGLLEKNVIYARDNGNNRPKTWGFNKYIETWNESLFPQPVMPQDNSYPVSQGKKTVMPQDNSLEPTVMPQDNSTVMPGDNTTVMPQHNNKRKERYIKESSTDDADGLVKLIRSYGFVYLDRNATALATQLVEAFGWDRCMGGIDKLKAAHAKQVQTGQRGIMAPLAYLRSVLDGDTAKEVASNKGFVDNAWAQLNSTPDYMKG